jgi:hypothetical protein
MRLSIADIQKNESMMIAATYFWSDTTNTFMFGLLLGEPIGNLGGPWWFVNMWLNAHMHKCLQWDFFAHQFPRDIAEDYELEDEESATRSPLNFSEAIIVLPGIEANED